MILAALTVCAIAVSDYDRLAVAYLTAAAIEGAPAIAAYLDAAPAHVTEAELQSAEARTKKECRG